MSFLAYLRAICCIILLYSLYRIHREQESFHCVDEMRDGFKIVAIIEPTKFQDGASMVLNVNSAPCCSSPWKQCTLSKTVRLDFNNIDSILEYPTEPLPYKVVQEHPSRESNQAQLWFSLYRFKEPKLSQSVDINVSITTTQSETEKSGAIHLSSMTPKSFENERNVKFLAGRLLTIYLEKFESKSLPISTHEQLFLVPDSIPGTTGPSDYQVLDQNSFQFPGNECLAQLNHVTTEATVIPLPSSLWDHGKLKWLGGKRAVAPLQYYGSFVLSSHDLRSLTLRGFQNLEVEVWLPSSSLTLNVTSSWVFIALLTGCLTLFAHAFAILYRRCHTAHDELESEYTAEAIETSSSDSSSNEELDVNEEDLTSLYEVIVTELQTSSSDSSSNDELDLNEDTLTSLHEEIVTELNTRDSFADAELHREDDLSALYNEIVTGLFLDSHSESSSDETNVDLEEILTAADDHLTVDLPSSDDSSSSSDQVDVEDVFSTFADEQLTFDLPPDDDTASSFSDAELRLEDDLTSLYDDIATELLLDDYSESSSDETNVDLEEILAAADDHLNVNLPSSDDSSSSSDQENAEGVFPTFADEQLTLDLPLDDDPTTATTVVEGVIEDILGAVDEHLSTDVLPSTDPDATATVVEGVIEDILGTVEEHLSVDILPTTYPTAATTVVEGVIEDILAAVGEHMNTDVLSVADTNSTEQFDSTFLTEELEAEDDGKKGAEKDDEGKENVKLEKEETGVKAGAIDVYYLSRFIPCPRDNSFITSDKRTPFMGLRQCWQRHQWNLRGLYVTPEEKAAERLNFSPITGTIPPRQIKDKKPTQKNPKPQIQKCLHSPREPPDSHLIAWAVKVSKRWSFRNKTRQGHLFAWMMSFIPPPKRAQIPYCRPDVEDELIYLPGMVLTRSQYEICHSTTNIMEEGNDITFT